MLGVDLRVVGLDLEHRLVGLLVGRGLPVAGAEQHVEEEGREERGGQPDHKAPEQPGAEADVDLPGDQDHGEAGHDEDVAGEDAGADGAGEEREALGAQVGGGGAGHGRGEDDLHIDVDRGEDRRHGPGHGVGQPLGPTEETSADTMRLKAPVAWSSDPITTPNPIRRPTLAMISPKPTVIASSVPVKPTPLARPR